MGLLWRHHITGVLQDGLLASAVFVARTVPAQ